MDTLPQDLLQHVLSFLPFPLVVQARLVCRRWLCVLTSHAFAVLWSSSSSSSPPWLLFHRSRAPPHHHHSNNAFLSIFNPRSQQCLTLPSPSYPCAIAASYYGLLCCVSPAPPPLLTIFNPVTRSAVALPPFNLIARISHLGIGAIDSIRAAGRRDSFTGNHARKVSFYIMVCGFSTTGESQCFELYDSFVCGWHTLPKPQGVIPFLAEPAQKCVMDLTYWNGKFCMVRDNRVLTYDPQSSEWGFFDLPMHMRVWNCRFVSLHSIRGRLFLEGNFQKQGDWQRRYPLVVGIAEANPATQEWVEVGYMPGKYLAKLGMGSYAVHSVYAAHSDPNGDEIVFAHFQPCGEDEAVIYHVSTQNWSCVSMCNKRHGTFSCTWDFKGRTFSPNLAISDCFSFKR